ncbi:hypothetical protein ACNQUF_12215, partial [Corynebacterium diphtheriae]
AAEVSFSSDFTLNFFIYAVIALSLYHAAFMCEAVTLRPAAPLPVSPVPTLGEDMESISSLLADYGADIPLAFWTNIRLAFLATLGSFALGVVLALFRISPVPSLRALGTGYVNVVRNTPLTIIMLLGVLAVWGS